MYSGSSMAASVPPTIVGPPPNNRRCATKSCYETGVMIPDWLKCCYVCKVEWARQCSSCKAFFKTADELVCPCGTSTPLGKTVFSQSARKMKEDYEAKREEQERALKKVI